MKNNILKFNDIGNTVIIYDKIISIQSKENYMPNHLFLYVNIGYYLNKIEKNIQLNYINDKQKNIDYNNLIKIMENDN